ncbi:MAG: sulfotransferase, partial [Myxococcota bacterium]
MTNAAFDEDKVLREAQARTGLVDFGEDSFREPLSMLLQSLREEAPLNEIGCATLCERIVESLEMRLRTEDWIRRVPEILEEEIEAPVVVVGLMRTGTTMLHRLLASDPRHHAAMWWETRFPAPPADVDWKQSDPRIAPAKA